MQHNNLGERSTERQMFLKILIFAVIIFFFPYPILYSLDNMAGKIHSLHES